MKSSVVLQQADVWNRRVLGAALVNSDLCQPELDNLAGARMLTLGVAGEPPVSAVALAPEVELERLDDIHKGSELGPCEPLTKEPLRNFDVFKDLSRLRLFHDPKQSAPYAQSVVCNELRKFLTTVVKPEQVDKWVDSETADKVWTDVFGRVESELHAQDTGDAQLELFASRRLEQGELPSLLPNVPEEWREVMRRSAVRSDRLSPDWFCPSGVVLPSVCWDVESGRGWRSGSRRMKLALGSALTGALLTAVGCVWYFWPSAKEHEVAVNTVANLTTATANLTTATANLTTGPAANLMTPATTPAVTVPGMSLAELLAIEESCSACGYNYCTSHLTLRNPDYFNGWHRNAFLCLIYDGNDFRRVCYRYGEDTGVDFLRLREGLVHDRRNGGYQTNN
ncbi:putative transmembrane protein [Gregarina niphandrodes]|uniref:Transmembrane protein n=1 Tax=Gregarina niphandrodes TaxID=110365 RepID=A0A023B1U7_GRENI|nr:putative transmembrane protein [Gregarina niphandrodes]EZG50024.1 putative transmembrane protein [Gregarina niphandrodes]|eukprot:XP_011132028.1 putative transmembrane protein [Gregarina niphandrodes]